MDKIIKGLSLALLSSFFWSLWSILSDVIVSINRNYIFDYLVLIELILSFSTSILLLVYMRSRHDRITKKDMSMMKYPVIVGAAFALGTIIFYSVIGNQNYPFVASVFFALIIPLAFWINKTTKEKVGRNYYVGTVVVFLGLLLEVFGLYGTNLAASFWIIMAAVFVMLFNMVGYYYSFYFAYKGLYPIKAFPTTGITMTIVYLVAGLLLGSLPALSLLTTQELLLVLAIAVSIFFGYLTEEFGIRIVRKAKTKFLNLAEIFTNLELVGVIIFSVFFLSLYMPTLVAGLLLVFAGIILVLRS